MNHFFTNLQYYLIFKVLAYSWVDFFDEIEEVRDLDELIVSHERYLTANVEKSLMGNDLIIYIKHYFHCLISFYALGAIEIDYMKVPVKCRRGIVFPFSLSM